MYVPNIAYILPIYHRYIIDLIWKNLKNHISLQPHLQPRLHFEMCIILILALSFFTKGPQKLASLGPFWGPFGTP